MSVRSGLQLRSAFRQTQTALGGAARRRDAIVIFVVTGGSYLGIYLYAIANLFYAPGVGFGVTVPVAEPLSHMFQPGPGRFVYEPVAIVNLGVVQYLFSPFNTAIGLMLAALVGANLMLSYLAVVQPASCGLGASSGMLASVPAILAGSACCAPVILLVLGITAGGTLLTLISWLLPVGIVLLIGSLLYLATRIDATALNAKAA